MSNNNKISDYPKTITEHICNKGTTPVLSVFTWAYNDKNYIKECVDSILMQKTTYSVEIIIHDDASNDGTAEIIRKYELSYPDLFKNILQKENQFSKGKSVISPLSFLPQGKYIALTHGDDYWTDTCKLQKQVDFLEANPEYGMVSSDVTLVDKDGNVVPDNNMVLKQRAYEKSDIDVFDLLTINKVNTLTVVIRAEIIKELVTRADKENLWYVYDYWFWLHTGIHHKIKVLPAKMAAYRVHDVGVSKREGFLVARSPHVKYDVLCRVLKECSKERIKNNRFIIFKTTKHLLLTKYLPVSKKVRLIGLLLEKPYLLIKKS